MTLGAYGHCFAALGHRCPRRRYPRDAKQRSCIAVRAIAPGSESSILKVTAIPVLLPLFPDEPSISTLVVLAAGPDQKKSVHPTETMHDVSRASLETRDGFSAPFDYETS
jgi:hypothetical protein